MGIGFNDLKRPDVIHKRRSSSHEGPNHKRTGNGCHVELHVGLKTLRRPTTKLVDLKSLTPEGMDHTNLAQPLLGDREKVAFAFVNACGLLANTLRVIPDRPHDGWQDDKRGQRERQVHLYHHHKCGEQHHHRGEHGREPFIVDRLDALRVVGHAEAGIGTAPSVVEFQRQRLQRRIKIGAQLEQGLKASMNKKIVRPQIHQPGE